MNEDDPTYAALSQAITDQASGPLVTKWLTIAEVVMDDGERYLEMIRSPDLAMWDQMGMLNFQLGFCNNRIEGGEGDE